VSKLAGWHSPRTTLHGSHQEERKRTRRLTRKREGVHQSMGDRTTVNVSMRVTAKLSSRGTTEQSVLRVHRMSHTGFLATPLVLQHRCHRLCLCCFATESCRLRKKFHRVQSRLPVQAQCCQLRWCLTLRFRCLMATTLLAAQQREQEVEKWTMLAVVSYSLRRRSRIQC
jgi:hypothetical protein